MARLASRSRSTALAAALVIAYAAGLVVYLLGLLGPVHNVEQATLDWRFLFRGPIGEKPAGITLVTVDEEAELPYWAPVPRAYLARVIQSLSQGGARLIGVDFYLGAPSFDAQGDSLLREAIRAAGNVVLVSFLELDKAGQWQEHRAIPYFQEVALDYGYGTFFIDTGVESVREGRVAAGVEGKHTLSMAGCLYAHDRGLNTAEIRQLDWSQRYQALPASEDDYRRIIDYNGPPFQYYRRLDHEMPGGIVAFQSHQVASLPSALAQQFFQDRIVLLGSGLMDAPDLYRTPFFSRQFDFEKTFGVEVHAHFLHTLLSPVFLQHSGWFFTAFLVLVPAFLAGLASVRLRPYWAFPLTLIDILVVWVVGFYLFWQAHLVVPLVSPSLASGLACLFGLIYVGSTDGRRRNEARERFGPMVGEAQLQQILARPEVWAPDGEEQLVAVVWARLRMVAPGLNHRPAREVLLFFQEYWQRMSGLIFKHGGAVFHYEPDGLGAVFGTPLKQKDHPCQGTMAAIDMAEAWLGFCQERGEKGWGLSVGVDTGRAFVGEIGGKDHRANRVFGKPVDQARLLAETQSGEGVRITEHLFKQVQDQVQAEPVDRLGTETVYRLLGRSCAPPIGAAERPPHPLWKYLGLDRRQADPVSQLLLRKLALFAEFDHRALRRIRPFLYFRTYKPGERIFSQGEVSSALYIIQRGTVDIFQGGEHDQLSSLVQRLGEGDFFGELALLSDLPRPASAVAYEPVEALVLFQADLYELIEREPELGVRLIRTLSRILGERLIQLNEELVRSEQSRKPQG